MRRPYAMLSRYPLQQRLRPLGQQIRLKGVDKHPQHGVVAQDEREFNHPLLPEDLQRALVTAPADLVVPQKSPGPGG